MKRETQRNLLLSKTRPLQLFLALTGAFLGLAIVMAGVQIYRDINSILVQKEMLGGDFIVINKKVSLLNTLSGSTPGFSESEKNALLEVKGIDKIGSFTPGNFKAWMELDPGMAQMAGPGFKSDMFFEAVPDEFVDVESGHWQWHPGQVVPIIIPSDYIKLYNMAFAQSQGLPVIPESALKSVTFKLRLRGRDKEETVDARIAGFTQRINSILVPQSFISWGNQTYGEGKHRDPSRLILHTSDPASPALAAYMKDKGYELNEEKLKASRMNSILQIIMGIVALVGALIVGLALLGFMQYNQLLAYRSAWEIQTLHWLGYPVSALAKPYIRFSFVSVGITFFLALAAVWLVQRGLLQYLAEKGFEQDMPDMWLTFGMGAVISLLMMGLSGWASYTQVRKLAN